MILELAKCLQISSNLEIEKKKKEIGNIKDFKVFLDLCINYELFFREV